MPHLRIRRCPSVILRRTTGRGDTRHCPGPCFVVRQSYPELEGREGGAVRVGGYLDPHGLSHDHPQPVAAPPRTGLRRVQRGRMGGVGLPARLCLLRRRRHRLRAHGARPAHPVHLPGAVHRRPGRPAPPGPRAARRLPHAGAGHGRRSPPPSPWTCPRGSSSRSPSRSIWASPCRDRRNRRCCPASCASRSSSRRRTSSRAGPRTAACSWRRRSPVCCWASADQSSPSPSWRCCSVSAAILVLRIPGPPPIAARRRRPSRSPGRSATGIRAVRRESSVRTLVGLLGSQYILVGALDVLYVVLSMSVLGMGEAGAGYLNSAFGAGGLIGAGADGRPRGAPPPGAGARRRHAHGGARPRRSSGCTPRWSPPSRCSRWPAWAAPCLDVTGRILLQRSAPPDVLADVFSLLESLMNIGLAFGAIIVPVLVGLSGAPAALIGTGVVFLLIMAAELAAPARRRRRRRRTARRDPAAAVHPDLRDAAGASAGGAGARAQAGGVRLRRDRDVRGR